MVHRGGGLYNTGSDYDLINRNDFCWNCSTCDMACGWVETVGYLDFGVKPYYAKCYNISGDPPANKIRFAFASQSGTTDMDPAVPEWNVYNRTSCWRIYRFYFNPINFSLFKNIFEFTTFNLKCLLLNASME